MKINLKAAVASLATMAVAGGGLLVMSAPAAHAAGTAPAWEPDPQSASYGQVVFYDANGNVVTSGSDYNNPFAWAVGATASDPGVNTGNLITALPQQGVLTANWPVNSDNSSPLPPTGAPADVTALAATNPVVAGGPAASILNFNVKYPTTSVAGYQDVVEFRVTDSGVRGAGNATSGKYWSSDVAFNPTTAPITVLGVTVPASGWAQVFPVVNGSSVTLTSNATGGNLVNTTPLTLTANVTPTTAAGTVNFFDGTTLIGSSPAAAGVATFTPATEPANGSHSYTASFVPTLGDIANPNTASATMISGSTSSAVPVTVGAPTTPTTGVLSADNLNPAYGATVNLTDTVSPTAAAGSVVFYDGTTALNATPVATNTSGVATLAVSNLPVGTDPVTAVFTPTSSTYSGNTSNSVAIVVQAPAACSLTGSSCTDQQNISVTVNPGTITITTPYTSAKPFTLPALALSTDGTYLSSSAAFPASGDAPITVTSTLAGDPGWTVSVAASNLTDPAGAIIPSAGLGLTGGVLVNNGKFPGTVTFTAIPGHNPNGSDTNTGLGAAPQTWAATTAGDGTATMTGTLGLFAPTSTPAGTYSGTITFSVI